MYWRYRSIPELADLPRQERDAIWREAKRDPFRPSDVLWFLLFMGVMLGLGSIWLWAPSVPFWAGVAFCVVQAVVFAFVFEALMILRYRPVIRRLRQRG